MSHRFDATLKDIVAEHPGDFSPLFELPSDQPVTAINVDLSTISAATDVALAFGQPIKEIVDLNFQSGPDSELPERLLLYNAALHARHRVQVRSILILLRPKADGPQLTGKLEYGAGQSRVEFVYEVIRLWRQPVEHFLRAGMAALPLATLCALPAEQPLPAALREVVLEIHRRLGEEANHAQAVRLMTAAYILTGLRVANHDLGSIYRGIGLMQESTAFDEAMEEGELRGEVKRSHRLLLLQARERFGAPDAKAEAELTAIKDLDRLERMAHAILTATSWQEFLATP